MLEGVRRVVLGLLRVPAAPQPPAGAPASLRVFRAAPNYLRLRLVAWGGRQVAVLLGMLFSLGVLGELRGARDGRMGRDAPGEGREGRPGRSMDGGGRRAAAGVAKRTPGWVIGMLMVVEVAGVFVFVVQAVVGYVVLRLDYEQRWYMVTDRSLRIRSGVWSVWEMTMSFANLQQVSVSQGPLQRWLGLSDLRVESAGGGGGEAMGKAGATRSLHVGFFHGVDNAGEVRNLILDRLRAYRETGLGDPDEATAGRVTSRGALIGSTEAAHSVLREVVALRKTMVRTRWTLPG